MIFTIVFFQDNIFLFMNFEKLFIIVCSTGSYHDDDDSSDFTF